MTNVKKIFLIAGEASGDLHASLLVKELRDQHPDWEFYGLGGGAMEKARVRILYNLPDIAALGLGDVIKKYFLFRKIFYLALRHLKENPPDLIILIDYPGFNLRFAKKIKRKTPVLYYISPQIWAWGGRRIKTISRFVDKLIVFFPFEEALYRKAGVDAECVGHPLVDLVQPSRDEKGLREEWGLDGEKTIVLLPGSRADEVRRILPVMLESAKKIQETVPDARFLLAESPTVPNELYTKILGSCTIPLTRIRNRIHDALSVSQFALITSGTATLEAAISERPFLILYKASRSTYFLGKRLIQIPYIGLVNVLAGKKIVPEFIQNEARPETIAHEAIFMLTNDDVREKMIRELVAVKKSLGEPGAVRRAARSVSLFAQSQTKR